MRNKEHIKIEPLVFYKVNARQNTLQNEERRQIGYVGSKIFLNGDTTDLREENLNPECIVSNKKYSFKDGAIPVKCWCLKADFAESSSSHHRRSSFLYG